MILQRKVVIEEDYFRFGDKMSDSKILRNPRA